MPEDSVEKTHNGIKKKGNWKEITEFAEDVEEAMEDAEIEEESVKEYKQWRPRLEESEGDVKRKTVEAAYTPEKKMEKETKGVKKDIEEASEKVFEASEKVRKKQNPEKELKDASVDTVRPFFARAIKLLRKIEGWIYSKIMMRFNSYYFDTKAVAVDMKHQKNGKFEMDVKLPEKDKRDKIQEKVSDKK